MQTATPVPAYDKATILTVLDYSRARLLATLDSIEKAAVESKYDIANVLAWRPGPGRAHLAWQAMHCAATHDRYLNVGLLGGSPTDPALVTAYAGGSTPADDNIPTLALIRSELADHFAPLRAHVESLSQTDFYVKRMMGKVERQIGESLTLIAWHEAHHQGQIHLTWNMFKAAHPA